MSAAAVFVRIDTWRNGSLLDRMKAFFSSITVLLDLACGAETESLLLEAEAHRLRSRPGLRRVEPRSSIGGRTGTR